MWAAFVRRELGKVMPGGCGCGLDSPEPAAPDGWIWLVECGIEREIERVEPG